MKRTARTMLRVFSTPNLLTNVGDAKAPMPKHKTGIAANTAVSKLVIPSEP
jgi:hypothetical protein